MAGNRRTELFDRNTDHLLRQLLLSRRNDDQAARSQIQAFGQNILQRLHKFGHTAGKNAVFIHTEPVGLCPRLHLNIRAKLVNLFAGQAAARDGNRFDRVPIPEWREFRIADKIRDVFCREVDAEIRLIRSVGFHGFGVANAAERRSRSNVILAVMGKNRREHIFQNCKYILLVRKGHLHIKLVKLARAAVAACILIPEARGNLEIAVKAGGHEQLLELLRCLGQRIEFPRMLACGNQVVARSLRRRRRQDGRGNLQEAMLQHCFPDCRNDLAAQNDVLFHGRIPQIQIAILQALRFICFTAPVNLKRQLVIPALPQNRNAVGNDFNVAGGLIRVLVCTLTNRTGHRNG